MLLKTLSNIIFHLYRQSELLESKIVITSLTTLSVLMDL